VRPAANDPKNYMRNETSKESRGSFAPAVWKKRLFKKGRDTDGMPRQYLTTKTLL
jgi:hypothetical protein